MVKPFAVLAVFFILIGMVSLTYWPDMRPDPSFSPEVRMKELERLSSPMFLMTSLSTGNFGYSSRTLSLVSEELVWRWPNTVLLVGVSIIATALVGFVLSLFFKPRRQKPQVYAHALRSFLFGSAFIVAILLLWILVYEPYVMFGSMWFPLRGRLSIPPPADPSLYLVDVLWHLVLPACTLTFVGVFRTLLILWSSGTPFTDKSRLRRSVYPFTTIDFALFISATVLVEYIFTWPGLGNMLLSGLQAADLNSALAAFAVLLALGAGLGVLSTLLDFLQIFLGLRQNLEQEANPESKTIEQPRHGTLTFVKALWKRKSLITGVAILACLILSILLAPIVAPYEPSARVADSFAPPSWMKAFPQYSDYPSTVEVRPYWNVTEGSEFAFGRRYVEGSINTIGDVEPLDLNLSSSFSYPYDTAPRRFVASFNWSAQDLTNVMWTAELLLTNPNGTSHRIWFEPYTSLGQNLSVEADSMDYFLLRKIGYDNPSTVNLAHRIFTSPTKGEYSLVFHASFRSETPLALIKAEISLRDFEFFVPGRVHGIFGTDFSGNDVFSQAVHAAGVALSIALPVSLLAVALGFAIGFVAGYFQGWVDNLIMVFPDAIVAVPVLPFLLVFSYALGRNMLFTLVPALWFLVAITATAYRNVYLRRSKGRKFRGMAPKGILISMTREFGANLCLTTASVVLLSTAIDFLGSGDPRVTSWGKMLFYAFGHGALENRAWWWFLPPILGIGLLALGLFLLGYGLDDD